MISTQRRTLLAVFTVALAATVHADQPIKTLIVAGQSNRVVSDGSEELDDFQTDPHEWKNLAAEEPSASQAAVIVRRRKYLAKTSAPQRGTMPQSQTAHQTDVASADVIVYGSTPGGFCAAIAAAREGASVILLEPTDHVGGMSTGGLSHCDSNQMDRSSLMGLFDEWHGRVVKDYTDRGLRQFCLRSVPPVIQISNADNDRLTAPAPSPPAPFPQQAEGEGSQCGWRAPVYSGSKYRGIDCEVFQ